MNPTLFDNMLPSHRAPVSSQTLESPSIDSALLSNLLSSGKTFQSFLDCCHGTWVVKHTESDEGYDDRTSKSEETTSQSGTFNIVETEHEEGWGTTNSRQVTHPGMIHSPFITVISTQFMSTGFFKISQPNIPVCHISLPPNHDFQLSQDEDDKSALCNLANIESQVTVVLSPFPF